MDYENKYKQALSRATFYNNELLTENQRKMLLDIFPELTMSEDEKMKDYIKDVIQAAIIPKKENKQKMIAWLEKQGEKKNTRKREIDDAYLQGICDAKHEIEKQGEQSNGIIERRKVYADKVIAWLVVNICDFDYYVKRFKQDFEI